MNFLNEHNKILNTDRVPTVNDIDSFKNRKPYKTPDGNWAIELHPDDEGYDEHSSGEPEYLHYSVLSFADAKNPDFFFRKMHCLDEFHSASAVVQCGDYKIVMPLPWSVLCTDLEYVQSIPLCDLTGKEHTAFCLNPINGFMPSFYPIRVIGIYPNTVWTAPQVLDKDFLVIPLGEDKNMGKGMQRGPECAIFSSSRVEIYKPTSDIWGD